MKSSADCDTLARLLYISKCAFAGEPADKLAAIELLARTSAVKNRYLSLTGVLMLVDGTFVQVLEGPPANVEAVFEQICCDLRHTEVTLVEFDPIKSRMFAEWEMAFLADGAAVSCARMGEISEIRRLLDTSTRTAERQMRQALLARAA